MQAGTEGGAQGGVTGWDEEDERLLWCMQIEAAALKSLDARPLLDQELQLLQRAAGAGAGTAQQQHRSQALADERSSSSVRQQQRLRQEQEQQAAMQAAMAARLSDIAGQLSLGRDREAIRQQVRGPLVVDMVVGATTGLPEHAATWQLFSGFSIAAQLAPCTRTRSVCTPASASCRLHVVFVRMGPTAAVEWRIQCLAVFCAQRHATHDAS